MFRSTDSFNPLSQLHICNVVSDLNSGDSQFFILLGEAKHLQGKYTVWGKIEEGMMLLDRLRTGSPPASPNKIIKMRLASDLN